MAFINKGNFVDVRKLELVSKRMLVSDGVFGVSDKVLGGFTGDLEGAFDVIGQRVRTTAQVEADYQSVLTIGTAAETRNIRAKRPMDWQRISSPGMAGSPFPASSGGVSSMSLNAPIPAR